MTSVLSEHEPPDLQSLAAGLQAVDFSAPLSPSSLEALYAKGLSLLETADFAKARKVFALLCHSQPGQARFSAGHGYGLLGDQEPEEASAWFTLACALEPGNAGYQLGLGRAFIACGHRQLARLALRAARVHADGDSVADRHIHEQAQALLDLIETHASAAA